MKTKVLKIICYVITSILFLFGLLIYIYPLINENELNNHTTATIEAFQNVSKEAKSQAKADNDKDRLFKLNTLYSDMREYNKRIYQNNQKDLKDAWSYEQTSFDLIKYGLNDLSVGVLKIPQINQTLPIYLGASLENMSKGAAQLGQTSMPIGGKNTNCVIAAHRGSSGGDFFLDIEKLKINDKITLQNYWNTLHYRVTKIDIINPDDVNKILIQKDKDMLTLITCHPYPFNSQRYVVYCQRVSKQDDNNNKTKNNEILSQNSSLENSQNSISKSVMFIYIEKILFFLIPIFLLLLVSFVFRKIK